MVLTTFFCLFCKQQQKNLEGYVGFASLPNQVYRKSVKRGFEFTLMVVGKDTGLSFLFPNESFHCFLCGVLKIIPCGFLVACKKIILYVSAKSHTVHLGHVSSVVTLKSEKS